MYLVEVPKLLVAANVCGQILREVEKQPTWSMAHVRMNPMAASLLHWHENMSEIYVVTRGYGHLGVGDPKWDKSQQQYMAAVRGCHQPVWPGSATYIPPHALHMLANKGMGVLEHLVFALPPFNPADVHLLSGSGKPVWGTNALPSLPPAEDCFDGARIIPYRFPGVDLSIAVGSVSIDADRGKAPHYHRKTTEWIYVVEGSGTIEVNKTTARYAQPGDWVRIDPGERHALRNYCSTDFVVVCVCSPAFAPADVYFD